MARNGDLSFSPVTVKVDKNSEEGDERMPLIGSKTKKCQCATFILTALVVAAFVGLTFTGHFAPREGLRKMLQQPFAPRSALECSGFGDSKCANLNVCVKGKAGEPAPETGLGEEGSKEFLDLFKEVRKNCKSLGNPKIEGHDITGWKCGDDPSNPSMGVGCDISKEGRFLSFIYPDETVVVCSDILSISLAGHGHIKQKQKQKRGPTQESAYMSQ